MIYFTGLKNDQKKLQRKRDPWSSLPAVSIMSSTITATLPLTSPIKFITCAMTPAYVNDSQSYDKICSTWNHENHNISHTFYFVVKSIIKTKRKTSIKKGNDVDKT